MGNANYKIEELYSVAEIQSFVQALAKKIEVSYQADEEVVCVGVLKGAWIFLADLVRAFYRPVQVDFIQTSSYGRGTETSGQVQISKEPTLDLRGKNVLIVDEILDTGHTLLALKKHFLTMDCKTVKIAVLLDKKERRVADIQADFVGKECPDEFLVGYGLDWGEKYRHLPNVAKVVFI